MSDALLGEAVAAQSGPSDVESTVELQRRLDAAKRDLAIQINKKKKLDRELANIEASIHSSETAYLTDPSSITFGNIVKGYEAYVKAPPSTSASDAHAGPGGRRKKGPVGQSGAEGVGDADRIFSKSSGTYQKALELKQREAESATSEPDSVVDTRINKKRRPD